MHSYGASGTLDEGDCSVFYRLIDVTHEEDLDRIWRDVWKSRKTIRGGEMKAHGEDKKSGASGTAHEGKRHVAYMIAKSMVIYRYT